MNVRPVEDADRDRVARFVRERWGSEVSVSRGAVHRPAELPGFVLGDFDGLVTYRIAGGECEVVTLDSLVPGGGTALLAAAVDAARAAGCRRLWLITTNDNTHALRFYQRRGMRIAAVRVGAMERSRVLKPEIPLVGNDGIPLRDEIELSLEFGSDVGPGRFVR